MCIRAESRLRNILSSSRFSPVTLDTWKIGQTLNEEREREKNDVVWNWRHTCTCQHAKGLGGALGVVRGTVSTLVSS